MSDEAALLAGDFDHDRLGTSYERAFLKQGNPVHCFNVMSEIEDVVYRRAIDESGRGLIEHGGTYTWYTREIIVSWARHPEVLDTPSRLPTHKPGPRACRRDNTAVESV